MKNLNYLIEHIIYQIFNIILNISLKKHEKVADNTSISKCVNKIENRIIFRFERGYFLKLLSPESMKLLRSTERKKDN